MYKAALVEDESPIRAFLSDSLQREFQRQNMAVHMEQFDTGSRFLAVFEEHYHYDLIFLDIEMPGMDGITVCRRIRALAPSALVVFISSRESLVFDTFEVQPFRFIRKNLFEEALPGLVEALDRELERRRAGQLFITEPGTGDIYSFDPARLLYVEAQRKDCRLVTSEGNTLIRCPLSYLTDLLAPFHFIKTHRSYLINCSAIFYIGKTSVILTNREELPVSRGQLETVREQFLRWSTE